MSTGNHHDLPLERKVSIARTAVFLGCPFFGHLLAQMTINIVEDDKYESIFGRTQSRACVSPTGDVFLARKGYEGVSAENLAATLIHEVMHPALDYWGRQGSRTEIVEYMVPEADGTKKRVRIALWNVAHDLSFNGDIRKIAQTNRYIEASDLAYESEFEGMSAEVIYDILLERAKENTEDKEKSGEGEGEGTFRGDSLSKSFRNFISKFENDISEEDAKRAIAGMSDEDREWLRRKWQQHTLEAAQLQEQQHGRGSLPLGIQAYVDKLREPQISWGEALSRWLGPYGRRLAPTFSRRYRKQAGYTDCIMPGFVKEGILEIVVFWDTSGSMYGREQEILAEIDGICQALDVGIRILCIDCSVEADHRDVHSAQEFLSSKGEARAIAGGGGSDFNCGFELLRQEDYRGVVVAITDGYIGVPAEKPDHLIEVLWVLGVGRGHADTAPARWGEVLRLQPDGTAKFE